MQITKLTSEQAALQDVARDVLGKESSPARVRELAETREPYDPKLWLAAGELGWHGLEVAEGFGGSGQTFLETSLILRELGRTTTPGPYLSQQLALAALSEFPDHPGIGSSIERLVAGEAVGAVVLGDLGINGLVTTAFTAVPGSPGSLVLSGSLTDVADIGLADVALIGARTEGEPVVLVIDGPAAVLSVRHRPTHDRTRSLYDVSADQVELPSSAVLAAGREATELLESLWCRAAAGVALDGVGGAAKVLEMTVAYTSQRVQFGRVIATFQAVKHTCADMFVESEVARIAVDAATMEIAQAGQRRRYWSSVAKSRGGDAYAQVAGDALQMHGGIGMTWQFNLHYWLKRAKLNQAIFGSSDAHRARLAREL